MALHNSSTSLPRETEPRLIDHNDSIRADYSSADELHELGAEIARHGIRSLPVHYPFEFAARHKANEREILRVYRTTAIDVEQGAAITPAAEWLLDNYYIVEEAIQEVRRDFPRHFYRQLPVITIGDAGAMPRTMALAWLYVAHTHSSVTPEALSALVEGFQSVEPLRIGELWAMPSMLRFVLIENLRRISSRVERSRRMRQQANEIADELIRLGDREKVKDKLSTLESLASDTTFAAQFLYRLRDGSQTSALAISWLEDCLEKQGSDAEEVLVAEHNRLSSGNATMSNIINSLREIDDTEWSVWFEEVSLSDRLLREKSDFSDLDFGSRNAYREKIERLARRSEFSEMQVTQKALEFAMAETSTSSQTGHLPDVGDYLVGKHRKRLEKALSYRPTLIQSFVHVYRKLNWLAIAGPIFILTILAMAVVGWYLGQAGLHFGQIAILLMLFSLPASEGATGLFNTLVTFIVPPSRLIGYEFKNGIPESAKTLLVVPCLIGNRDSVDELIRNLEVHYLANPHGEIYFALLSDWADSAFEEQPEDLEVLEYARQEIATLCTKYREDGRDRFFLLHRRRLYNPSEGVWMGWERKRGKLHELNLALRGDLDTSFLPGANVVPDNVKFVMTLDSDTRLLRDAVTRLVGKMCHPNNMPVFDPETRKVISGYGILQPRVTPSLTTGKEASAFQRIYSVNRGIDPYVFTVSDVYQDLVGEGTFTGKGLYHVDAFEAALKGRIDENTILSHDLLEGSMARCALVTDVELIEDFPVRYEVETSRQHRWARGDWQLLPFIFSVSRGVSGLARWKMVDNLRRSLTPIAWALASALGWSLMQPFPALLWQMLLIFSLFVAPTLSLISGIMPRRADIVASAHVYSVWSDIMATNAQVAMRIAFIAHSACLTADAVLRSLYRLFVSGKLMLEWRTAAQVQSAGQGNIIKYYKAMWQAPAFAMVGIAFAAWHGSAGMFIGLPFAFLWIMSPFIAWYVSQSAETEDRLSVSDDVKADLRKIARRTWRYFETFVTAGQNFLPPDNFQETPAPVLASRTSPTNIGVYLLSVISARDFGWISLEETIQRLEQTIATIDRMDKYRGHLYNWYRTDTLEMLPPLYVSSVDSGNLAGHLIAVSSQCRDWCEAPSAHLQGSLDGISDVAFILKEVLADLPDDRKTVRPLRRRIEERIDGFVQALETMQEEREAASLRVSSLAVLAVDIQKLTANLNQEIKSGPSNEVVNWADSLVKTCRAHITDSEFDLETVETLRRRLSIVRDRARDIAFSMDFSFLFRPERRLLSIGYRLDSSELDGACYDLLASEARLTSLFGIAKGDLPTEHWYRLGRQVVPVGARGALVSWSGSMFEYLMPPLVMQERQGSILNQTNNLVVREQIAHGKRLNIPWGISEAAFNARDHELTYQYTNFGVPTLGLKRGLGQNAVVAPYASLLACQYNPEAGLQNLMRLKKLGALGYYGFHDAVDFTPTRVPEGKTYAVVRNYMAHHHGMSIAAVANVVFNGRLRELFHSDPVIEAAELLLQEKAPRVIPVMAAKYKEETPGSVQADLLRPETRSIVDPANHDRETVFLSNGHYSIMLTATGSGYSRWNGQAVARWKPDPTEDRSGTFIFLRDTESGQWWSSTTEPRTAPGEKAYVVFGDDRAVFTKTVGDLTSEVEVIVATENDAEGRKITLLNRGTEDRFIELTSYLEPVLSTEDADNAHPLFSKMFIRTEFGKRRDVIRAWRAKRNPNEADMYVAHLVANDAGTSRHTEFETDRRTFIGRGRTLCDAAAFDSGSSLSGTDGYTLDPILSLRRVLRVPAGKKVSAVFWTIAAPSRAEIDQAIERYRHADAFNHETIHAWTRSQVMMRHIGATSKEATAFQMLGRYLTYPDMHLRAESGIVAAGLGSQSQLWPLAISGDYPIFTLRINDDIDLQIARQALRAQEYLRARGVMADLVIINEKASSYAQDLQHTLDSMCENLKRRGLADGPRHHIFAVRRDLMEPSTLQALLSASRAVFHAQNGNLADQIVRSAALFAVVPAPETASSGVAPKQQALQTTEHREPDRVLPHQDDLDFWNGYGGFARDGRSYVVRIHGGQSTPQPWINVISNDHFGFHVSAEGAGFSWSTNSRDYQLTPWSNDPVINRSGEAFYVADLENGVVSSPFACLSKKSNVVFETSHGLGFSRFESDQNGLNLSLIQTVDPVLPLKISELAVTNKSFTVKKLRIYGYLEWVLGNNQARTGPYIVSSSGEDGRTLFASNPFSQNYARRTAFFKCSAPLSGFTASRREFIGSGGSVQRPKSVYGHSALSGSLDMVGDPCAALSHDIELSPGQSATIRFVLGDAANSAEAQALARDVDLVDVKGILRSQKTGWDSFTGTLAIDTPDKAMNLMVNTWLPYQSLSCRIRARTAFYQASGAFGFRDQLQDTLAYLMHRPDLARAQIINAASRQFLEGDVQHWWLPETGAGVRTLISDDVVWLGHAVACYCNTTGDTSLLDEELAFLTGPALQPEQHDAFCQPEASGQKASIYEHAARGLDLAISRTGQHGLPLILGGDWNDGMNRVGIEGRGESIWLGWFLAKTLADFLPFAQSRNDAGRCNRWARHLEDLKHALETGGWDGDHYLRGFYDDGKTLGSSSDTECRIDSIAQSWSVLSGLGMPERQTQAMNKVGTDLVDDQNRLVRLFTPPFSTTQSDPGYIRAYPPGVRENGGQYTHAATWAVLAYARLKRGDDAWNTFDMLNPVTHARDRASADQYRVEPYVVAADVYAGDDKTGRGGWTWYTGSAGWLYRAAVEGILGITKTGDTIRFQPCLPQGWNGYSARLLLKGNDYNVVVTRSEQDYSITVNGVVSRDNTIRL